MDNFIETNKQSKSFEDIIEKRINFGRYQYTLIFLLGLVYAADGVEIYSLSLIIPLLKKEWELSDNIQGFMGSSLFFGIFLGSLGLPYLSENFGRKKTLIYVSLLQFILGVFSSILSNIYLFLTIRLMFGFLLGISTPLVPAITAEEFSTEKRGKITLIINSSFVIGMFCSTLIAWLCLDNMISGNWRLMVFICSFPNLILFIGIKRFFKESPRFLIIKGKLKEGIENLNEIIDLNNDDQSIWKRIFTTEIFREYFVNRKNIEYKNLCYFDFEQDLKEFKNWREFVLLNNKVHVDNKNVKNKDNINMQNITVTEENKEENQILEKEIPDFKLDFKNECLSKGSESPNIKEKWKNLSRLKNLFQDKYRFFTLGLWITWFSNVFITGGLSFIFPFLLSILDKKNKADLNKSNSISIIMLSSLADGFSIIIAYFLIDSNFGRKYSILISQIISCIFILLIYIFASENLNFLLICISIARLFGRVCMAILYPYTAEVYSTSLRVLGVSLSRAIGMVAGCIMPIISVKLLYLNIWSPFLFLFFIGLAGIIGTYILPYDTKGKHLDT